MTQLRTRQPTGRVAYPMIVVEGAEKVGKSYVSFALSASDKVGRILVLDMGEGSGDEYAELGRYELVEHDGTWPDFISQLQAAAALPMVEGKPNVIVIDSITVVWEGLKAWADKRARSSRKARQTLQRDPDAEISIPMNIWTDVADRWGQMIHALRYSPVIAVLIARGKDVAKVGDDGQPIAGQTDYKIEAHKATLFNATCHVRCLGPGVAKLIDVRSLRVQVPPAGIDLPADKTLEHLIFELLGAGQQFGISTAIASATTRTGAHAKQRLVEILTRGEVPDPVKTAGEIWTGVKGLARSPREVTDEQWSALADAAADRITKAATEGAAA